MNRQRAAIALIALTIAGCTQTQTQESASTRAGLKQLNIADVKQGVGDPAREGDLLVVQYRGTFKNGKEFDSNTSPAKDAYGLILGGGMVIRGWDRGLIGVRKGGVRKLEVPYRLGYGDEGSGNVPPKTDLYFEIKILDIVKSKDLNVIEKQDVKVGTGKVVKDGSTVTLHMKGTLPDGKVFETTEGKKPYKFKVGALEAFPYIEMAVKGMREGGVRKARVPPGAAFGSVQRGAVPGNTVMTFEFRLLKVE